MTTLSPTPTATSAWSTTRPGSFCPMTPCFSFPAITGRSFPSASGTPTTTVSGPRCLSPGRAGSSPTRNPTPSSVGSTSSQPVWRSLAGRPPMASAASRSWGVLQGETQTHRDQIFGTHSGDGNMNRYHAPLGPDPRVAVHPQPRFHRRAPHPRRQGGRRRWAELLRLMGRPSQDRPARRRDRRSLLPPPRRGTVPRHRRPLGRTQPGQ